MNGGWFSTLEMLTSWCASADMPAGKSLSDWKAAEFTCFPQGKQFSITFL